MNQIRVVSEGDVNDIYVCWEENTAIGVYYTVLVIHNQKKAKQFLEVCAAADVGKGRFPIEYCSKAGKFAVRFPYQKERPLEQFYMGTSYSPEECEKVCVNIIAACMSSGLPYPILYLILRQRQLNLAKDLSVYFSYQIDLSSLNPKIGEKECVSCCARILSELPVPKEFEKAASCRLLKKKTDRNSYRQFRELYRDIRIAGAPKHKHSLYAVIGAWFQRKKDGLFKILFWICFVMVFLAAASFLTQAVFGDMPWMRLFFNGFKKIGTETL